MNMLILGLALFLVPHSLRVLGEGARQRTIARLGEGAYKGLYSLLVAGGLVLIVLGYAAARQQPVLLWVPPVWTRHLAALLTVPAIIFLVAPYIPGNSVKARLHHPMVLGVKLWALAHLLANNTLADVVLFGAFLVWAVLSFRAAKARDRAAGTVYAPGTAAGTGAAVVGGVAVWAVFAFWAHRVLIGVGPFN